MSDRHLLCPNDNCLGQVVSSYARGHEEWHCQTCQMVVSLEVQARVSYNRGRRAAVAELGAAFVDRVFEVPCGTCGRTTVNVELKRCDLCWQAEGRLKAYAENPGGVIVLRQTIEETEARSRLRERESVR